MYSVLRFIGGSGCSLEQLERIGNVLNVSAPGVFKRLDSRGGRISVSVSTAETWEAHEAAASSFLHSAELAIREARLNDVTLEFDVAVESEDFQGVPYLTLPISVSFHETLVRSGVALVFTFSNPAP